MQLCDELPWFAAALPRRTSNEKWVATYIVLAYMVDMQWSSELARNIITGFCTEMRMLPVVEANNSHAQTAAKILTNAREVRESEESAISDGLTMYKECWNNNQGDWYVHIYDTHLNERMIDEDPLSFQPCPLPPCTLSALQSLRAANVVKYDRAHTREDFALNQTVLRALYDNHDNLQPYFTNLYAQEPLYKIQI